MKNSCFIILSILISGSFPGTLNGQNAAGDPDFFPVAVWLQNPSNAAAYRENGINTYVGIWGGLNREKLDQLKKAGIKVICDQNAFCLQNLDDNTIYGWMHGDEPDNAQLNKKSGQYDPCIDPAIIIKDYQEIRKNDPSRPVYLNLGQGVSYINYVGRGACRGNIDKYKISTDGYLKGCDICSFDIYPVNNRDSETQNNLWYVAKGIDSLRSWTNNSKPVWCWIESTRISEKSVRKPTPAEVRAEVWMALIHGANGFGYFCHSFAAPQDEAALLHDAVMMKEIKAINTRVNSLARVLNSPGTSGFASVSSSNQLVPVDFMTKKLGNINYIFAVSMRCGFTTATFNVTSGKSVEVIDEDRTLIISEGKFSDEFSPYQVHLYKIINESFTSSVDAAY
jgi:hypothetical protein